MTKEFCKKVEEYKDKEIIFKEGDDLNGAVFLVLSGKVRLTKKTGTKQVVVETVEENEGIGDVEFLGGDNGPAFVTAQALGKVEICRLDPEELKVLAGRLSPLFKKMIATLCSRFKETSSMLVDFTLEKAEAKK